MNCGKLPDPLKAHANNSPLRPRAIQRYAERLDGRRGSHETKSDLYVLDEPHADLPDMPTVFLRRVPAETAIETGFVLPEPQLGHLNLSTIYHYSVLPPGIQGFSARRFLVTC